jgi:hypothetical protein
MTTPSRSSSPHKNLQSNQTMPAESLVSIFLIAQRSQTDNQVIEQILSQTQDGGSSIDGNGSLVRLRLAEAFNKPDGGADDNQEVDEDEEEDKGRKSMTEAWQKQSEQGGRHIYERRWQRCWQSVMVRGRLRSMSIHGLEKLT